MLLDVAAFAKAYASPTAFVVLLGMLGAALAFTPYANWGRWIALPSVLILLLMLFGPLGHLLAVPLERRFPPPADLAPIDGIIVLGGAAGNMSGLRGHVTFNDSAERLTAPIELRRLFPDARLVFASNLAEARLVRDFWRRIGLDRGDALYDQGSTNTYENARAVRALVAPKPGDRWLLVTSAAHMPRAVGVFRRQGFPVVPYPVDYRTTREAGAWRVSSQPAKNLGLVEAALHEWLGLVAYRLEGRTDALFPAPRASDLGGERGAEPLGLE